MSVDWEKFNEDFDKEWEALQEQNAQEPEQELVETDETVTEEVSDIPQDAEVEDDVTETTETVTEEVSEVEEQDESDEDVENFAGETSDKRKQSPEENKKFAEMRHQLQEAQRYKQIMEEIATSKGITAELLAEEYEKQKEEEAAKSQGVPVEIYRRLQELENYKKQSEVELQQQLYISKIDKVKAEFGIDDEDPKMKKTWDFIRQKKYYNPETYVPVIDFSDAFKIVNFQELQNESAKKAKQAQLAAKKQRQTQANPVYSGGTGQVNDDPEDFSTMSSEEFRKYAQEMGVSFY